jgi:uncharacterized protein YukE
MFEQKYHPATRPHHFFSLRGEKRVGLKGGGFFLPKSPFIDMLPWFAALCAALCLALLPGIVPGFTAGDETVMELTVEEARELARSHNIELQLSYLALEQAALALEALERSIEELERQRGELALLKESLEEERERLQQEIEGAADPEEQDRLRRELRRVELFLAAVDRTLEESERALEELNEQYGRAEAAYAEGEAAITLQEEALDFKVEYLFAGALIVLGQQPLQQVALEQLALVATAEQEKEKAGYSTPLQVEEAASRLREMEAAGDELAQKLVAVLDELCLTCGLTPGRPLTLVAFTPVEPRPVNLEHAVSEALASGWLAGQRRERLAGLEAERDRIGEQYGVDSRRYRAADLAVRQAGLELQQAEGETRAAVRRTYYALVAKENQIRRAEADLALGHRQSKAIAAGYQAGHASAAEAAAGPLARQKKEADLVAARYDYHLAWLEFDLARRGFILGTGQRE